jgi:hypothetical protein
MTRLSRIDREALERAIALTLAEPDAGRVAQVREMLAERSREEVGKFCSYHRQCKNLNPKPWELVPSWLETDRDVEAALAQPEDHTARRAAALLTQRLLAAGLSRYEPSPLAALEQVEAERARSSAKEGTVNVESDVGRESTAG